MTLLILKLSSLTLLVVLQLCKLRCIVQLRLPGHATISGRRLGPLENKHKASFPKTQQRLASSGFKQGLRNMIKIVPLRQMIGVS